MVRVVVKQRPLAYTIFIYAERDVRLLRSLNELAFVNGNLAKALETKSLAYTIQPYAEFVVFTTVSYGEVGLHYDRPR